MKSPSISNSGALKTPCRLRRTGCCVLLALVVAWSGAVSAHARLTKSKPAEGAEISAPPSAVTLWFNEQPESEFSTVKVLDAAGKVVVEGVLSRTRTPNGLRLKVPAALPAGAYVVRYRILSVDGHIIEGQFDFRIAAAAGR